MPRRPSNARAYAPGFQLDPPHQTHHGTWVIGASRGLLTRFAEEFDTRAEAVAHFNKHAWSRRA